MDGYYKIDELRNIDGLYEMWEDELYGEDVPAVVTLDGQWWGETNESLMYIIENPDELL